MIGAHSEYFHSSKDGSCPEAKDVSGRQKVFEDFVHYALSKPEVRIVPASDIIGWCRDPHPLNSTQKVTLPSSNSNNLFQVSYFVSSKRYIILKSLKQFENQYISFSLYSLNGRMLIKKKLLAVHSRPLKITVPAHFSSGHYVLKISVKNEDYLHSILIP